MEHTFQVPTVNFLTLQSSLVNLRTSKFNIKKNSTFCPHSVFMCCVRISEQRLLPSTALTDWSTTGEFLLRVTN
jgi:hypothetical protein